MHKDKLSIFFIVLLVTVSGLFLFWGGEYTHHNHELLFLLATGFGLFMAFNIGGNDVANSFGTSVGAGTLTIKQALAVAAIFEVSGAVIAGGEVTDTIRKGIVDLSSVTADADFDVLEFVFIMMSALFAAATWLLLATRKGWPVSTTHSIIGGIVGSSITLGVLVNGTSNAFSLVHWDKIGTIALSWVISPVLGGTVAYTLYFYIKKYILHYNEEAKEQLKEIKRLKRTHRNKHKSAMENMPQAQQIACTMAMVRDSAQTHVLLQERGAELSESDFESDYYRELLYIEKQHESIQAHRALEVYVPLLAALGSTVITAMLLYKGLKHINLNLTGLHNSLIIMMTAALVWMVLYIFSRSLKKASLDRSTFLLFSWMQVFTAAGFAFSHGSNDIANAIGPFAAVLDVFHAGTISSQAPIPTIAMVAFGIAMVAGLWFIGKEVIMTVGTHLTEMHPASGFAAELSAAAVVMLASILGIPVSSTHILVGAVLGIGLVNRSANWRLMKPIAAAWLITLPSAGLISSLTFVVLRKVFL